MIELLRKKVRRESSECNVKEIMMWKWLMALLKLMHVKTDQWMALVWNNVKLNNHIKHVRNGYRSCCHTPSLVADHTQTFRFSFSLLWDQHKYNKERTHNTTPMRHTGLHQGTQGDTCKREMDTESWPVSAYCKIKHTNFNSLRVNDKNGVKHTF